MSMIIQKVQAEKIIKLSPAWVGLFEFVQQHPYITFEKLQFVKGDPKIGTVDIKIIESHVF